MTSAPTTGWGIDPHGTSPWGGAGIGVGISLTSALAISTNQVQVVLSGPAMHISQTGPGDAFNLATWSVIRNDTGGDLSVINVAEVDPHTYTLTVLYPFGGVEIVHTVSSASLVDPAGNLLVPPRTATFIGAISDMVDSRYSLDRYRSIARDLNNPQIPAIDSPNAAGTLTVNSAGDYQLIEGTELVRKLVFRRLSTNRGEFFHMPQYGIGWPLKRRITVSDLSALKAEVERQVKREPEVKAARAIVSIDGNGILTAQVSAQTRDMGSIDVTVPLSLGVSL